MKLRWSGEGRQWLNVIGVMGSPTLPTIDQTLTNTIGTAISGTPAVQSLLALMAPTISFDGITLKDISAANRAEFISAGAAVLGSGVGDTLPLSVTAVVTARTALAGKSFRGRTYFSGFTEAQNDATGRSAAAVNVAIVGAMNSINGILQSHSMTVAVLSRPQSARTIPARDIFFRAGTATAVTTFLARNSKWESQRRRTGRN
jgi:hypothetical protein